MNLIMLHIISKNTTERCLQFFQKIRKTVKIIAYRECCNGETQTFNLVILIINTLQLFEICWSFIYCSQLNFLPKQCRFFNCSTLVTPAWPPDYRIFPGDICCVKRPQLSKSKEKWTNNPWLQTSTCIAGGAPCNSLKVSYCVINKKQTILSFCSFLLITHSHHNSFIHYTIFSFSQN